MLWSDLYDIQCAATVRLNKAETAHLAAGGALHCARCDADLTRTPCDNHCNTEPIPTRGTVTTRHEYENSTAHRKAVWSIPQSQIDFKR